jgi:peptidoglycan L-alanyl-D-glutamate endopeptidase CwlK
MSGYGSHSETLISQAHPDIQKVFRFVITRYDHSVTDAYRTKAKQNEYFDKGLSKIKYPTVHNTKPSNAIDGYPYIDGKIIFGVTNSEQKQCIHFAAYVMGVAEYMYSIGEITHRFRNGADWDGDKNINDQTFMDICHFEIVPNDGETFKYFEV